MSLAIFIDFRSLIGYGVKKNLSSPNQKQEQVNLLKMYPVSQKSNIDNTSVFIKKQDIVEDSAALNSTTVSGVITPASSAQVSGHVPQITIPKYTWALPVGDIDPGYRLGLSETERSLPVSSPFWFYIQIERIFPQRGTNKFKAATFI